MELVVREQYNCYEDLMTKQIHIQRVGRAKMIDKLFQIAMTLQIEDKSIVYETTSLIDRYYNQ